MQNTINYLEDLERYIEEAETVDELIDLANQCNDCEKYVRSFKLEPSPYGIVGSFKDDFSDIEFEFSRIEALALKYAKFMEMEQEEESNMRNELSSPQATGRI